MSLKIITTMTMIMITMIIMIRISTIRHASEDLTVRLMAVDSTIHFTTILFTMDQVSAYPLVVPLADSTDSTDSIALDMDMAQDLDITTPSSMAEVIASLIPTLATVRLPIIQEVMDMEDTMAIAFTIPTTTTVVLMTTTNLHMAVAKAAIMVQDRVVQ